jgi:hypothetical protein
LPKEAVILHIAAWFGKQRFSPRKQEHKSKAAAPVKAQPLLIQGWEANN